MSGLRDVQQLRELAGDDDQRITNLHECSRGLTSRICAWRSLPARPRSIEDAIVQADAIARGLRELRAEVPTMPRESLTRRSPRVAGSEAMQQRGGVHLTPVETSAQLLDGKRISVLLNHHANYVETVLFAVCDGSGPGIVGRQALAFSIERFRQIAAVLE